MSITVDGLQELQLKLNSLGSIKRSLILRKIANKVASQNKRRITAQTDLDGNSYKPRAIDPDGRNKKTKKLLTYFRDRYRVISVTDDSAVIGIPSTGLERLGLKNKLGETVRQTKAKNKTDNPAAFQKPATRQQAKRMIAAGFKIKRKNGKGSVSPTIKYITEHYTIGQAGYILRQLKNQQVKDSWDIKVPARSFSGITDNDVKELLAISQSNH